MKILIQNSRITGTATEEYTGPDEYIDAPADFDAERMGEYVYADGAIDWLFFWQAAHCKQSYESEWQRRQLPNHYHPRQGRGAG